MAWPFKRRPSTAGSKVPVPFAQKPPAGRELSVSEWRSFFEIRREGVALEAQQAISLSASRVLTPFAFKLFKELANDGISNLFFSPVSIMMCLGLAFELASGETRREIARVLESADVDQPEIDGVFALLKRAFRERPDLIVLAANSLWCSENAHVDPERLARLRERYGADLSPLDSSPHLAVARINRWVTDKTNGKIDSIVHEISALKAALVAVNVVYFKGLWLKPFERKVTHTDVFRTAAGLKKRLPMMHQVDTFSYYEDEHLQAVALPYNEDMAMYVVLPAEGIRSQEFHQSLSSDVWQSWLQRFEPVKGTIELPRFKADFTAELRPVLKALGMERAFDPAGAEFEGIRVEQQPLWIENVIHKAVVEVNEEGTLAAAATGFTSLFGAVPRPPRTFRMIVDRPFLIAIYDASTGTILFVGWIGDPQ